MAWKVLFIIFAIINVLLITLGFFAEIPSISYYEYFASLIMSVGVTFVIGLFYSLGWKQKLFSNKVKNILTVLLALCVLDSLVFSSIEAYQGILAEQYNSTIAIMGSAITFIIMAVLINIFLIPFYIGMYKYKKEADNLLVVRKPYWKLFCFFNIPAIVGTVIFFASKFSHFTSYNFLDYFFAFSCIYEIIFMIGFAWEKDIFNKLFWKITFVPYVACLFMIPFYNSELFVQDFKFNVILNQPMCILESIIINILFVYVLYKYAFTKKENCE